MAKKIQLNEQRKTWYLANRYLRMSDEMALTSRLCDIMSNISDLNQNMMISPRPEKNESMFFLSIFQDLLVELMLRGIDYRDLLDRNGGLKPAHIPNPTNEFSRKAADWQSPDHSCIYRFTENHHATNLLDRGEMYFSNAKNYSSNDFCSSVRDDELELSYVIPGERAKIRKINETGDCFDVASDVIVRQKSEWDYWSYCMSASHSIRMYGDFKADQCVAIMNPKEFIKRVFEAWRNKYGDDLVFGSIQYIDPFLGDGKSALIPFSKPLRYFYQAEVRFIGMQPGNEPVEIQPRLLEIGSIRDIAELVIK